MSIPRAALRCVLLLLATSMIATARSPESGAGASTSSLPRLDIKMDRTRLANGLQVITVEDRTAPVITVGLAYDVGGANEQKARTGFAHLFEHLMFQGSEHVAPGQHTKVVEEYGGTVNATTGMDWTFYFASVPANQLDLVLYLESDRLRSLNISAENLAREKEVVKEERRLRIENQAYRSSFFRMQELLYDSFAYGHDGIGSLEDISAATLEDVRNFFDTHYRASNLVLVLVGDFETKSALGKVEQYFGALPALPDPPQADRTEPRQEEDRRLIVEDALAPLPQLSIAFKAVPGDHADYFALSVLSAVLQNGHSSRLHEDLVRRRELVTALSGSVDERRGAGALYITATVRSKDRLGEVESGIYRAIEQLQERPVADWELEKAKNSIAASYLNGLRRSVMRAIFVGAYALDFNDPGRVNTYLDRIAAVTKEDVRRAAIAHLRKGNRTVVVTMPKKQETTQ